MSRFDPSKQNKTAVDWSVIAYQAADDDKAAQTLVIGAVLGMGIASFTTPILGGVIGAYFVIKGIQKACDADKNKKYIKDAGCVAHVLENGNFRAYLLQNGKDKVLEELQFAEQEGLSFSDDALDFYEDYLESTPQALPQQEVIDKQEAKVQTQSQSQTRSISTYSLADTVDIYDPHAKSKIDIISEMVNPIGNFFIVGLGGSGKGIILSNALREIKVKYPDKKIFVINGKDSPKERGYFDGVVEKKQHKVLHCETAKPQTVAAWFEACVKEYDEFAVANNGALLVIDEGTIIGSRLKAASSTALGDKLIGITSCGGDSNKNIWFIAQTPFVGANGSDLSGISQLTPIAIINKSNLSVLDIWKTARLFKKFDPEVITELVEQSPRNRAYYFGKTTQWYSMPELKNYSGYDRDTGTYLPGFTPQLDSATNNLDAISDLESSLNFAPDLQNNKEVNLNNSLSDTAQFVLDWLVKNRPSQWIKFKGKEGRDMSFIKFLSEKTIDAELRDKSIQELINAEKIDISPDGDYIKSL